MAPLSKRRAIGGHSLSCRSTSRSWYEAGGRRSKCRSLRAYRRHCCSTLFVTATGKWDEGGQSHRAATSLPCASARWSGGPPSASARSSRKARERVDHFGECRGERAPQRERSSTCGPLRANARKPSCFSSKCQPSRVSGARCRVGWNRSAGLSVVPVGAPFSGTVPTLCREPRSAVGFNR